MNMKDWLKTHTYSLRLTSFTLMLLVPIALYAAARAGTNPLIWLLLLLFAACNALLILLG